MRRLSALERDSVTPPNLVRSLSAIVYELDRPEPSTISAVQGRLALVAGRLERADHEDHRDDPGAPVPLDGLRLDAALLRAQLLWLLAHDGQDEADGLVCLVEALLDRLELGR
jgi:hypothetical protein